MSSSNDTITIVSYLVGSKAPQKLAEIGKALDISGSTAFRVLSQLKESGWVIRDPETKRYRPGVGLLELALSLISQLDLKTVAAPFLEKMGREVDEGVTLSTRIGLERIYIHHIQTEHELQQVVSWGKRLPLWCGAPGKAILAYVGHKDTEAALAGLRQSGATSFASGAPINEEKLRRELSEIRTNGFSVSSGERVLGTNSVAAPIFDHEGVVGAISVSGPEPRLTLKMAIGYGPLVRKTADSISIELGRRPAESMPARGEGRL
jgi:DNA-binding IclR family transcriptional regulator